MLMWGPCPGSQGAEITSYAPRTVVLNWGIAKFRKVTVCAWKLKKRTTNLTK